MVITIGTMTDNKECIADDSESVALKQRSARHRVHRFATTAVVILKFYLFLFATNCRYLHLESNPVINYVSRSSDIL